MYDNITHFTDADATLLPENCELRRACSYSVSQYGVGPTDDVPRHSCYCPHGCK